MSIFAYACIGSNDIKKSTAFFEALFSDLGIKKLFEYESGSAFGVKDPEFWIVKPFNGDVATPGNGATIAFNVSGIEDIQRLHKKALELGATNEGDPGERYDGQGYFAYFRDLDGNKFSFYKRLKEFPGD